MSPTKDLPGVFPRFFERLLFPNPVPKEAGGVPASVAIDFSKGIYAVVPFLIIRHYKAWGNRTALQAWAQLASYGILWISKSALMPDLRFTVRGPRWYYLIVFTSLAPFWLVPLFIVRAQGWTAPLWRSTLSTFLFGMGVALHFASDMQKDTYLKVRRSLKEKAKERETAPGDGSVNGGSESVTKEQPTGLLTDGVWSNCRNPNYFGELLIYSSFCLLSPSPLPALNLASLVVCYWYPSMVLKDRSLMRYKEFADWKKRTWKMIPGVF